jgi:uncharacterized protein YdeI (YjbR/CyaY-like superfamily)
MRITFFKSPAEFRGWLERHHDEAQELWVGFYKKDSGKPSITWPESVDEALCFGWIDGIRKSVDGISYTVRFTPRKSRSIWSAINIKRVQALKKMGRMQAAGLKAFEARDSKRSGVYSFEQRRPKLDVAYEKKLQANKAAWKFFQAQAPWYQRTSSWWVMSAKKEETRRKRLATLIDDSAHGRTIAPLTRPTKSSGRRGSRSAK